MLTFNGNQIVPQYLVCVIFCEKKNPKTSINIYHNYPYIRGMHSRYFFNHNKIIVTIVSVFCSSALNAVHGDPDSLFLNGYHNNGRTYFGSTLIANESLLVQGI